MRSDRLAQTLGGALGPRIADLVDRTIRAHLAETAAVRAKIHADGLDEFHRRMADEMRPHLGVVFRRYADQVPTDEPLHHYLAFLADQPGEAAVEGALRMVGFGAGTGMTSGIAAILAPENQALLRKFPFTPISPADAAVQAAAGIQSVGNAAHEAANSGVNSERFALMIDQARAPGDMATVAAMMFRGLISEKAAAHLVQRMALEPDLQAGALEVQREVISPQQAADMVQRGIVTDSEGATLAADSGMTKAAFELLVLDNGEPPGLMQLLEAYRRGFINQARLQHGVRQSRIRDEWLDVVEALRYEPMSTADAVDAVVQNHITNAQGASVAQQNGLEPAHWQTLVDTAGEPLSHEQMTTLYYRGIVTREQVDQAVRESRTKNKYVAWAFDLGRRLPSERLVLELVAASALTQDAGARLLIEQGYDQATAAAIVKAGAHTRTSAHKTLVKSDLLAMYADGVMNKTDTETHLQAIGYSSQDAAWLIALTDAKLQAALMRAAQAKVRSGFDGHKITRDQAHADLIALGVSDAKATHLTNLWQLERDATPRPLTQAQIIKGAKEGVIALPDAQQRLEGLGMDAADAALLLLIDIGKA